MQYYYGSQMPLRVLDECEFWKEQEEEHTVVIRELVQDLEPKYVLDLKEWEKAFTETHHRVVRFMETAVRTNGTPSQALYKDLIQLIHYCLDQSQKFIYFCAMLIEDSSAIRDNKTAAVVMKHIIRESEYFIGVAQTVLYQNHL
ncbi:DUF2935 domain-containing protein [Pseudalkalibacillus sp. SCS-8]|uniref:DUF2935 domain-containing protein n=1 Tax=Pseudalkalibacillus nanhaiensis TaxID=3115291 RepID=UPI0032D9F3C3